MHYVVLRQTTGKCDKTERQRLRVSSDDTVLRVARLRIDDGDPIGYETLALALSRLPGLDATTEMTLSIQDLARITGLALGRARERISVVPASSTIAPHLHVATQTPLRKIDRVVESATRLPIEWRISYSKLAP